MSDYGHSHESRGATREGGRFAAIPTRWIPACAGMTALLALAGAALAQPAPAPKPETRASRPNATGGEAQFLEHCAMCHGPNGMGTGLIGRHKQPALLEQRGNISAAFIIAAARSGIGNMPAIPRGEVSDADMKAIADYLAAGPHSVRP